MIFIKQRTQNKEHRTKNTEMYLIISQLCLSLTGVSFPENVFEDILFYLLQGQRKERITLGYRVNDFHKMTPFQLSLSGFPQEYYSDDEYDTLNKIKKLLGYSKGFKKTFFTKTSAISSEKHIMEPVFIYFIIRRNIRNHFSA